MPEYIVCAELVRVAEARAALAAQPAASSEPKPVADDAMERALTELVDKILPGLDTGDLVADAATASKALDRVQPAATAEPVAVVGADFALFWVGAGPIAPLVQRHGLKVGSYLYAAPATNLAAHKPAGGDVLELLKDARHRIANLSRAAVPFDDPLDGPVLRRLDAAISAQQRQERK